jgi:hypothetical protein
MGMSEGKPGKTGPSCGMWVAGFFAALGAGLSILAMMLG